MRKGGVCGREEYEKGKGLGKGGRDECEERGV